MYDLGNGPLLGPPPKVRKERKISVLLKRGSDREHCAGVNSLALDEESGTLFTASRDATIKRWGVEGDEATCSTSYEGHTNWVNDILLVNGILASCSSDRTIKLWDAGEEGLVTKAVATCTQHSDYVMALAASPRHNLLASGGLRAQVFLWDLNTAMQVASTREQGGGMRGHPAVGVKKSVYALSMDAEANIVAVGSPEAVLRIIDARSGEKLAKLRGHTDNIRAVLLNAEGTLCLTGSSDQTMRLWDLGQQRCVQTFAVHTDSVWVLHASPDFNTVYSGGRDCCVYRTHLPTRTTELLVEEKEPILKLALDHKSRDLWVATTSSTVRCWRQKEEEEGFGRTPPALPTSPLKGSAKWDPNCSSFLVGPSPQIRLRQSFERGNKPTVKLPKPAVQTQGIAPITKFAILAVRRHILTQDAEGHVEMWDATSAAPVRSFGKRKDLQEVEREVFRPAAVSSWFSADCKMGSLCLHLEYPSCFVAEIYAADLGLIEDVPEELKLNFGEHFLKAAFQCWASRLAAAQQRLPAPAANGHSQEGRQEGEGGREVNINPSLSSFREWGCHEGVQPIIIGEMDDGERSQPWMRAASEFTGREACPEMIPNWVMQAVLFDRIPDTPDFLQQLKCAFVLAPAEGSGLPVLLPSRLSAPRVLRIYKVVSYAVSKLGEDGFVFGIYPVYWDPELAQKEGGQGSREEAEAGSRRQLYLELLCNGMAVPHDLSLAAVRAFMWRRSDDLMLHYRVRRPDAPAPLPSIKPPP